jgi:hypothetical protein
LPTGLSLAAFVLLALVPIAFWPSYLATFSAADGHTHAHAALGIAWLLLLAIQPRLVQAGRRAAHRRLGRLGLLVGAAFFVSGVLVAHRSVARMGLETFAREGRFVYLPLAMAAIFGAALVLAVVHRRSAPAHGRFMAATSLALLDPLVARLLFAHAPPLPAAPLYQVPAFVLCLAALAAMVASMPAGAPGRKPFARFAAGVAAVLLGFFAVPHTAAWLAFAAWFRALPIT